MMRPAVPLAAALLLVLLCAAPAHAWGFPAHEYVMEHAVALLPAELRPFFESRKAFLIERSVDPDMWRNAGFETEPPNHFLDLGFEPYGPYPFEALPRSYDEAVRKFGREVVDEQGTLPWRTAEFQGRLRRAFEELKRPGSPYTLDNIAYYATTLGHYVGDAHMPFHAHVNYDGQMTNQRGIHARFESELFARSRATLAPPPGSAGAPVLEPSSRIFELLLEGYRLVDPLLAADRKAAEGREFYDDGYFDAFAVEAGPILERRINESIVAIAAFITGAWEQAGRPAVPLALPRAPRRIPRS